MNWNILPFFEDEQVTGTILVGTVTKDSAGVYTTTFTDGGTIKGMKWSKGIAEGYFHMTWAEDVSEVLVTSDSSIDADNKMRFGSNEYFVDSVDNVADQGDIYLIGLRSRR